MLGASVLVMRSAAATPPTAAVSSLLASTHEAFQAAKLVIFRYIISRALLTDICSMAANEEALYQEAHGEDDARSHIAALRYQLGLHNDGAINLTSKEANKYELGIRRYQEILRIGVDRKQDRGTILRSLHKWMNTYPITNKGDDTDPTWAHERAAAVRTKDESKGGNIPGLIEENDEWWPAAARAAETELLPETDSEEEEDVLHELLHQGESGEESEGSEEEGIEVRVAQQAKRRYQADQRAAAAPAPALTNDVAGRREKQRRKEMKEREKRDSERAWAEQNTSKWRNGIEHFRKFVTRGRGMIMRQRQYIEREGLNKKIRATVLHLDGIIDRFERSLDRNTSLEQGRYDKKTKRKLPKVFWPNKRTELRAKYKTLKEAIVNDLSKYCVDATMGDVYEAFTGTKCLRMRSRKRPRLTLNAMFSNVRISAQPPLLRTPSVFSSRV